MYVYIHYDFRADPKSSVRPASHRGRVGHCYLWRHRDSRLCAPAPATVTLSSSQNPSSLGASVTFTVTVGGSNGTATGSVDIFDLDGDFSVTVPVSGGVAQTTTSALPLGDHDIEADFNPTGTNYTGNSDQITQTVNAGSLSLISTPSATTQVGQSYSQPNVASGGVSPYSYSVTAGSLPAGTSINASTGTVIGHATTAGAFSYTVQAADSSPTPLLKTQTISGTITQGGQTISFTPPSEHGADGWSGDADGDGDLGPCGELHLDDDGRVHGERQFGNAGLGRHLLDQRQPGRQRQLPSRPDGGAGASRSPRADRRSASRSRLIRR